MDAKKRERYEKIASELVRLAGGQGQYPRDRTLRDPPETGSWGQ